jgi:hypothetical protein
MDGALDFHAVPHLAHDEYADVQLREAPLAIPTPDEPEEEVPQQVKAAPKGCWCNPAVGRGVTKCGKSLNGGYTLRDESYLGELCKDGCFSDYEWTHLIPAAREAARRVEEAKREQEQQQWLREQERRNEAAAKRERIATEKMPPIKRRDVIDD